MRQKESFILFDISSLYFIIFSEMEFVIWMTLSPKDSKI